MVSRVLTVALPVRWEAGMLMRFVLFNEGVDGNAYFHFSMSMGRLKRSSGDLRMVRPTEKVYHRGLTPKAYDLSRRKVPPLSRKHEPAESRCRRPEKGSDANDLQ